MSIVYGLSLLKRFASLTRHDGEDDKHVDGLRDRGWQQEADSARAAAARAPPAAVAVRAVLAHQQDWLAAADQGSLIPTSERCPVYALRNPLLSAADFSRRILNHHSFVTHHSLSLRLVVVGRIE